MLTPLLCVLALFVVQTLLPASLRFLSMREGLSSRIAVALGPRDEQPEMRPMGARAARALANLHEAMPVFLGLALAHMARGSTEPSAVIGAWIFFAARVAYVPAYLSGIPGVRSLVWVVSWVGLGMLVAPLLRAL